MSYLKRFAVTGSICPSTRVFGERAAVEVESLAPQFDRVVVAGIGSGVVANRILMRCPDAVFVECEDNFAAAFAKRNPNATVVTDRIENLFGHHPELRTERILLASFVPTAGTFFSDEILRFFICLCRNGGLIMQMRYLPHQMSSRFFESMRARGVVSERLFTVARNLPPVSMYGLRSLVMPVAPITISNSSVAAKGAHAIQAIAAKTAQPQSG